MQLSRFSAWRSVRRAITVGREGGLASGCSHLLAQ